MALPTTAVLSHISMHISIYISMYISICAICIFIFIVLIVKKQKYCKQSKIPLKFQHSGSTVTIQTLKYVREYKRILLRKLVTIFNKYNIRYILADGNLLEIHRKSPIIQDDDIDIIVFY